MQGRRSRSSSSVHRLMHDLCTPAVLAIRKNTISETFTHSRMFQCLPSPVKQADAVDVQTPSNTMFGWVIYSAALADCQETLTPLPTGASLCPQRQHYWVLGEKEATLATPIPYIFVQQAGISCSSPPMAKELQGFIHLAQRRQFLMEHKACRFHVEVNKRTTADSGMAVQDLDLHPTGISVQQAYYQYCMC